MRAIRYAVTACSLLLCEAPVHAGEVSDWQQARALDSCAGYRAFLLRYPETRFATLIRKRTGSCPGGAMAGVGAAADGVGGGVAEVEAAESGTPGWTFEPEMVAIPAGSFLMGSPAGSFLMGSPAGEAERASDEGPQHRVQVPAFELGRSEVTFAQWDACVSDGGCSHRPEDRGWGRGDRPVINVSFEDARGYVVWLSRTTGKGYRLPSEAEWEYAARAGTTTAFSTGACITTDHANYDGNYDYNNCGAMTGVYLEKTQPVGSYPANPWGLQDMHGNVWEWTADCWNNSYAGAPGDGSAWERGDCGRRVVRGGSWNDYPRSLRSAYRYGFVTGYRYGNRGFRVARTLTP